MDEWQDAAREAGEDEIERLLAKATPDQAREAILEFLSPLDFSKFIFHLARIVEPETRRLVQDWMVAEQVGDHIVRFVGVAIDTETEALRLAKETARQTGRTLMVTLSMRVENSTGEILYRETIPNAPYHRVYPDGRVERSLNEGIGKSLGLAIEEMLSAAKSVSLEWDAFIGVDDKEGHDDPFDVGGAILRLRKAREKLDKEAHKGARQ